MHYAFDISMLAHMRLQVHPLNDSDSIFERERCDELFVYRFIILGLLVGCHKTHRCNCHGMQNISWSSARLLFDCHSIHFAIFPVVLSFFYWFECFFFPSFFAVLWSSSTDDRRNYTLVTGRRFFCVNKEMKTIRIFFSRKVALTLARVQY